MKSEIKKYKLTLYVKNTRKKKLEHDFGIG